MAQKKKFKPLRMTIMGCGGTGKSVLINTLVTCIRKIFDDNDDNLRLAKEIEKEKDVKVKTVKV